MKRTLFIAAMLLASAGAFAQESVQSLNERYERLVRNLGYDGIGIETVLDKWEALDASDGRMLEARFNYWFTKSRQSEVTTSKQKKYLGQEPMMVLKDKDSTNIYYYEEFFFDDKMFGKAMSAIDKACALHPDQIGYRFDKVNALLAYEKGYTEMTEQELLGIIADDARRTAPWKAGDSELLPDEFPNMIQEYCYILYSQGTGTSLDSFKTISERMSKQYPGKLDFACNIGSYWITAHANYKKAIKTFDKVLKVDPKNENALKNCIIAARKMGDNKLAGKYQLELAKITSAK